ncbi:MAG: hypothetical protein U1A78_01280 [Polyangia bacterium]
MFASIVRAALLVLLLGAPSQAFAAAPVANTSPASGITSTSAVLNGIGTPNGEATTGRFRYSSTNPGTCNDTFGTRVPAASGTDLGSGSTAVPYSITTTGLTPGTTYYFCAIVSNASGTSLGPVLSFTIPYKPVVVTSAATGITSSTATLQGSANPTAASTTGWFRYSSVSPGGCDDSFGTRVPYGGGGESLGAGITAVPYTQSLSGLLPSTTYYYCAIASNSYGTAFGGLQSFTTPATAPTVSTGSASALTRTTATLNGSANPGGDATIGWFRYGTASPGTCNDTFGKRAPSTGGTALGSGSSGASFSQAITGLTAATTYYYCAIASNSVGTSWGSVQTFITPSSPTATTLPAGNLTSTSATLNGAGNPNRTSASGWFRYATTNPGTCDDKFGSRAPVMGSSSLGSGTYDQSFSQNISGLSPATTYYYCAIVGSTEGTAFGSVLSFTTATAPTLLTTAATFVTATGATLTGTGSPNGADTYGWFRYSTSDPGSCNDGFGYRTPYGSGGFGLGAGSSGVPFEQSLSGLSPNTKYYYCAIGSNSYGMGYGGVQTFTTPAMGPSVSTGSASALTRTTATLNGSANPGGDATTAWFRYSTASPGTCNDTFGTRAPSMGGSSLGAGSGGVSFSQAISGLTPATTYYFCAIASNSLGTAWGTVQTFITPSSPTATTLPASNITTSTATLNGAGNPNRSSSTGWFRYSTTNPGTCDDKFGSRAPVMGASSLGGGTYDQSFSQNISGLSSGTIYYYCAIVSSTEGTAFGSVLSFTTAGAVSVVTNAATGITANTATLTGAGSPNGADAYGWFRYSTSDPGSCNDGFGYRTPYGSGGFGLGAGSSSVPFEQSLSGLSPGTKYFYCAIASNSYGMGYGSVQTFTTPATGPTVSTGSASALTRTTATLNGSANPGGDATTGWFRYSTASPGTCNDTFGTRAPTMSGSSLGAGAGGASYSQPITGLTPATTYYFCAIASNSLGTAWGSVQSFITPSSPTATTLPASNITTSTATLNGQGNPNRASTTGWFRYSITNPGACDDKFGSRAPVMGASSLGGGTYDQSFAQNISGLSPATTYYYCAIVTSSEGTAFGSVLSFTTAGTATAVTNAATNVTATTATLNGAGNPNNADAYGWFRYSTSDPGTCSDGFGYRTPYGSGGFSLGSGSASVPFEQSLSSLSPGTKYYYCAIVSNSYGVGYGAVQSFTTPAQAPTVSTGSASALTRTTATLNGSANPGGDATTGWFRYSTTSPGTCNDTFGTRAPTMGGSALGAGTGGASFSQPITGLTAATTYYYCAIASNSLGTAWGSVQTFITPSAPTALTSPASNITNISATLNGAGNPNRAATTGWFRYSTTNPGACDDKFGSRAPVTGASSLGSGISDYSYSQSIPGLSSGTTYYYCAIVASNEGTAFGAVLSFTTAGAATATTSAATSVTSTTATLNGAGTPNGDSTTAWFRYSPSNPGTCNDAFGWRSPSGSGGFGLGSGSTSVPFGQALTGLSPGVTYYYCAIASNSYGTGLGAVLTFTTPPSPPTVSTDYPSGIATTLNGSANPNGSPATGWFRIATTSPGTCNDTFGTRVPGTGGTALGGGSSYVSFSNAPPTLTPGTTYYYCAIASNAIGTSFGVIRSFTAPMPPTTATLAATPVTATSATLNGSANPNGYATVGWFRYSTSSPGTCNDVFGTRTPDTSGTSLGSGNSGTPFSAAISGLSPATTYYFCAIASSAYGTSLGSVLSFTTPPNPSIRLPATTEDSLVAAPKVVTRTADSITADSVVLNATANPAGLETTGWFRYDTTEPKACDDMFGNRAPQSGGTGGTRLGAGTSPVAYSQAVLGLAPGTTYYYCAIAGSEGSLSFGAVLKLTTRAAPPSVTTTPPMDVTADAAVLNGSVVANGEATTAWFRYSTKDPGSCTDSFGERAPTSDGQALGAGTAPAAYSVALSGLVQGATYYYCAIASNAIGTTYGDVVSFVPGVGAPSVTTEAASAFDATSATINGTVDGNGSPAAVWFRYGEVDPGACDDGFGLHAAALAVTLADEQPAATPLGESTLAAAARRAAPYSAPLGGLKPGTTYYYCVAASNRGGASFGKVRSFTTASADAVRGTVEVTAPTSEPAGGCSFTARPAPSPRALPLAGLLSLALLALFRRRQKG